jgi:hypothetical protein
MQEYSAVAEVMSGLQSFRYFIRVNPCKSVAAQIDLDRKTLLATDKHGSARIASVCLSVRLRSSADQICTLF